MVNVCSRILPYVTPRVCCVRMCVHACIRTHHHLPISAAFETLAIFQLPTSDLFGSVQSSVTPSCEFRQAYILMSAELARIELIRNPWPSVIRLHLSVASHTNLTRSYRIVSIIEYKLSERLIDLKCHKFSYHSCISDNVTLSHICMYK